MNESTQQSDRTSAQLTLRLLPGRYAFCRLDARETIPAWAIEAHGFVSMTRVENELSIVAPEECVPAVQGDRRDEALKVEAGFVALRVGIEGQSSLDFGMVGILATLTAALADVKIPVCAVSTYDTDILLIKAEHLDRAKAAFAKVAKLV